MSENRVGCVAAEVRQVIERIPLAGVRPLAPGIDTIGPMAREMAGVAD